uniref:Coiled-coil-helix-coiled-coil-helix domain containing 1 n=1 Tax=Chrysemys picta bellii TaxID=8478 RepID=A0A8C3I6P3_CHRPI
TKKLNMSGKNWTYGNPNHGNIFLLQYFFLPEATCTTEISLLMACWKQNEFNDSACAKEIQTFYDCVAKTDVEHKERLKQESLGQMGNFTPKTVNKLLRRFPNITDDF